VVPPAALPLVQDNGLRGLSRAPETGLSRAPETGLRCDEVQRGAGALRYSGRTKLDEQPGVLRCSGYTGLGQARAEGRQRAAHSFKGDQRAVPERDFVCKRFARLRRTQVPQARGAERRQHVALASWCHGMSWQGCS
jgi:hypothetical protein